MPLTGRGRRPVSMRNAVICLDEDMRELFVRQATNPARTHSPNPDRVRSQPRSGVRVEARSRTGRYSRRTSASYAGQPRRLRPLGLSVWLPWGTCGGNSLVRGEFEGDSLRRTQKVTANAKNRPDLQERADRLVGSRRPTDTRRCGCMRRSRPLSWENSVVEPRVCGFTICGADRKIPQPGCGSVRQLSHGGGYAAAGVMVTVNPSAWSWRMWLRALRSVSVVLR